MPVGSVFDGLPPGSLGGTYGANPVCCAAASATIHVIESEGLVENAARRGDQLRAGLEEVAKRHPGLVIDVRGRGLMQAVELDTKRAGIAGKASKLAHKHGMMLLTAGARETVRMLPPLIVSESEIAQSVDIMSRVFQELSSSSN